MSEQYPLIETDIILRQFLLANPIDDVDGRVWAGLNPPEGYKPIVGPGILLSRRPGGTQDYSRQAQTRSYQFRTFALTDNLARVVDRNLYQVLNDAQTYQIMACELETPGQLLADPDTSWQFVLSFYSIMFRNVEVI